MTVSFESYNVGDVVSHTLIVTCVVGLVRSTYCAVGAALHGLTVVKLGTLAYWIVFLLRKSNEHIGLVPSI